VTAPYDRLSKRAIAEHAKGQDLAVERGPRVPAGAKCTHSLPHRKLARSWLSADGVTVDIIEMVDSNEYFGTAAGPRTLGNINLAATKIGAVPLMFIDKQTVALTIHDVGLEGPGAVMCVTTHLFLLRLEHTR
jgi:hypothetical protein